MEISEIIAENVETLLKICKKRALSCVTAYRFLDETGGCGFHLAFRFKE